MIITQTPFRMSFFCGGTDMENYFNEYGGARLIHYTPEEWIKE
jgi:D-glycero-alpha-D-manno-heptose-7-phosphate kinase